ncbi:hypothetical protein TcCL_ESM11114 [Trypanosoma cruzi]|nr:hypothetical protein TcCL_ESM11114 [Trypanosoma cruzi]
MNLCATAWWRGGLEGGDESQRRMHPRASSDAGRALGSRRDPMGAGVSVTAVLRAGTSTLAAAFHADGTLLCFTIIHFSCGGMAGTESGRQNCPAVSSLPSLLV